MIDFTRKGEDLLMRYVPERGNDDWLVGPLESEREISLLGRALSVRREIYRSDVEDGDYGMDACYRFIVGKLEDDYYRMDRRFLGIEYDLLMRKRQPERQLTNADGRCRRVSIYDVYEASSLICE